MESIIAEIEEFYETETVIRACIVCDDENTLYELVDQLRQKDHSVDMITEEELTDERMNYVHKLHAFRDSSRMIAMSYPTWYALRDRVEIEILPYQNVFILVELDDGVTHSVASYLKDAAGRGFFMEDAQNHYLVLSSNN